MFMAYDHITSRSFWRSIYPANRVPEGACTMPSAELFACNEDDAWSLASHWVTPEFLDIEDGRLHVLSFDRAARRSSRTHETRAWTHPIINGSFFDLGDGTFVESPEFVFLRIAATHSLIETIAYGNELCGAYSFHPSDKRGMRQRRPLTNVGSIESFIARAKGIPGFAQAKRAIPYIVENSASPMETVDEMLLCLPCRLGGYGIQKPEMNHPIELSPAAARIARKSLCYADMFWPHERIDVEHQGLQDHTGISAFDDDRHRINALKEMGIDVIEVTGSQVGDLLAFESIALRIAKATRKRVEKAQLGAIPSRIALRTELFTWNRTCGRGSSHAFGGCVDEGRSRGGAGAQS